MIELRVLIFAILALGADVKYASLPMKPMAENVGDKKNK